MRSHVSYSVHFFPVSFRVYPLSASSSPLHSRRLPPPPPQRCPAIASNGILAASVGDTSVPRTELSRRSALLGMANEIARKRGHDELAESPQ
jgi:hypothetical protein